MKGLINLFPLVFLEYRKNSLLLCMLSFKYFKIGYHFGWITWCIFQSIYCCCMCNWCQDIYIWFADLHYSSFTLLSIGRSLLKLYKTLLTHLTCSFFNFHVHPHRYQIMSLISVDSRPTLTSFIWNPCSLSIFIKPIFISF